LVLPLWKDGLLVLGRWLIASVAALAFMTTDMSG